ncbi:MAG: Holliday junction branch migration DNA helicase RuvB [Candidatus Coatesbacteria bacterium]|nr:Holliday junction branch migration DNA helicase RuvB [Candidatus Coatesbacteria bacterium]
MNERVVDGHPFEEERLLELSIRPESFAAFVGQEKVKERLLMSVKAAAMRDESLDHVLLAGPPGLGKTTLAHILAKEMGVSVVTTTGPALEKSGDIASILTNLSDKDILFIDEIHRLNRIVEEFFYPALEDFHLDIIIGQGPSARTIRLDLPKFTLVGATTRSGLISAPLRDRFGIQERLDFYTEKDLVLIVERSASILEVAADADGAREIAKRCRGTPRIANRLLKRVRDFAQVKGKKTVTKAVADEALKLLEVDEMGLDKMDRSFVLTIIEKFNGGPVGVETIAAAMSEERDTIEDVYEPFLMQIGFIQRTPRGRVATKLAFNYFHTDAPVTKLPPGQKAMF